MRKLTGFLFVSLATIGCLLLSSCYSRHIQHTDPPDMPENLLQDEASFRKGINLVIPNLQEKFLKSVDGVFFGLFYDPKSGRYFLTLGSEREKGTSFSISDGNTENQVSVYLAPQFLKWKIHDETKSYTLPSSLWMKPSKITTSEKRAGFYAGAWYKLLLPENKVHIKARLNRAKASDSTKEEAYFFEATFYEPNQSWIINSGSQASWPK